MWIIRHQNGTMMGHCTNRPGTGNTLPDGSEEVHEYVEDDPNNKDYNAAGVAEIAAYQEAQREKRAVKA